MGLDKSPGVSPETLRVKSETIALYVTLASVLVGWFLLEILTLGPMIPISAPIILVMMAVAGSIVVMQRQHRANSLRCSEKQLPEVYRCGQRAAAALSMDAPEIYVQQSPIINAFAFGMFSQNGVSLNSSLVEAVDEDELTFILGHEFTHIKCDHTFWNVLSQRSPIFRIPVISHITPQILAWTSRQHEYTADRGGLVACRDLKAAIKALLVLKVGPKLAAKVDLDELEKQGKEVDRDGIARGLELASPHASHPFILDRVRALQSFADTDTYKSLLGGFNADDFNRRVHNLKQFAASVEFAQGPENDETRASQSPEHKS